MEDSVVGILFRILAKDVDLLSLASNLPQEGEKFKAISLSKKDRITVRCSFLERGGIPSDINYS